MIQVNNLQKSFGDRSALAGVSFRVGPGEIYGYLGPNGAGKTTTIRILTGLNRRDRGTVHLNGHDIERDPVACKAQFGLVPQHTNLDADLSVAENLIVHGRLHHMPMETILQRIGELLDYLELGGRLNVIVKDLSGGLKRRLLIARALLHGPKILFLDEPSVGLDPAIRRSLWGIIKKIKNDGTTVFLTKEQYGIRERDIHALGAEFVPFSAHIRMSGVNMDGKEIRKGATDSIKEYVQGKNGTFPTDVLDIVSEISSEGGTPLVVAEGGKTLGVIRLSDIIKGGIRERFTELRRMGIKTVMITGDNPLTAAAVAAEAGVDDFLAEATPEAKLKLIKDYQAGGKLVAMTGDGTNDAPALAQADVAVAMNTGTQAAKEAGNMVDLDSNPTKLIEIVEIGKQLLMTRGALTTFSISNDVAKYFAILPAALIPIYPELHALNIMGLSTPQSAILSAVIFNALIIIFLIPLSLKGVKYRPLGAATLLRDNILVYGLGGLAVPFIGIKLIDMLMNALGIF
jgi:ABC-type Na+ transport system ATPase subunit NatA/soluble P-type ATPase